jgi:hypothetical protein
VPCVASVLQPCWAALAEVDARRPVEQAQPSSTTASRSTAHRRKTVITPGGASVPTVRVAHTLEWIREFARGQAGAISKVYSMAHRKRPVSVIITTDASPWGYGGFIMKDGVCLYYYFQEVTPADIERFGIVVGQPKYQALLENLALLIAVRLWSSIWAGERLAVGLRSDSMATLLAWRKERSRVPAINAVTREVSLDLADGLYTVDALEHIPGKLNEWADALSRQHMPGNSTTVPKELLNTRRSYPGSRVRGWWRLEARPSDCVAVNLEEEPGSF